MRKVFIKSVLFCFFVLGILVIFNPAGQIQKVLEKISVDRQGPRLKVLLHLQGQVEIDKGQLLQGNQLALPIKGLEKISVPSPLIVEDQSLKRIKIRVADQETVYVIFEFKTPVPYFIATDVPGGYEMVFIEKSSLSSSEVAYPQVKPSLKLAPPPPPVEREFGPHRIELGFASGITLIKDTVFKELYGQEMVSFRGEYAVVLPLPLNTLDLWLGICYARKDGESSCLKDKINFQLWRFSYALRYLYSFSRFTAYLGPGLDLVIYREKYPPEFLIPSTYGRELGFHVQGGIHIYLIPSLSLDLKLKYNFLKTMANQIEVDLGGAEASLGLRFGFGR